MVDMVRLGPAASPGVAGRSAGQAGHAAKHRASPKFHHVLASVMARSHGIHTAGSRAAAAETTAAQTALLQVPFAASIEKPASVIPADTDAALRQAMRLEGVSESWQSALRFIVAKESSGRVDARNPVHSARGLFQLTAANYHLNPNGARSFGNAVEEAQGGIRYIQQRYGTSDNAVAFWQQHRWY